MRRAIKWISQERQDNPATSLFKLVENACLKFDLSPKDAEVLVHFFTDGAKG